MTLEPTAFLPDHNELILTRYRKAAAMREAGINPYPARFAVTHDAAQILKNSAGMIANGEVVSVLGRVMLIRSFGKAAFLPVRDGSGQIQVYVKSGVVDEAGFRVYKEFLDAGDLVGVTGKIFITKTGEISIEAATLTMASKAVRQLPDKFHGLRDVEARYRQRYVDLIANPEVAELFRSRSRIMSSMRRFLDESNFMEVETPMMQPISGGASARPFETHHNALDMKLYLRIAPELYLKRLVVGGMDRVYEINRNFRNEGISPRHNPEFTMLELYAGSWNASRMMDFTEAIIRETTRLAFGTMVIKIADQEVDLSQPVPRVKMIDAVREATGQDLHWTTPWPEVAALRGKLPIPAEITTTDAAIVFLFEELCEKMFVRPTFIVEFPKSVSPLAKSVEGMPEVADRFELYANGVELANGYSELNDPAEQFRRFEDQVLKRKSGDLEATAEIDVDYVRALEYGMMPTAGLGIGIDRLTMLLTGAASIRDVILFPQMKAEIGSDVDPEAGA